MKSLSKSLPREIVFWGEKWILLDKVTDAYGEGKLGYLLKNVAEPKKVYCAEPYELKAPTLFLFTNANGKALFTEYYRLAARLSKADALAAAEKNKAVAVKDEFSRYWVVTLPPKKSK